LIYSIGYTLATITAFGILMVVHQETGSFEFSTFHGFSKKNPLLAWMMVISMCSLAGIPLTAGFFGKFYIFSNAMDQRLIFLVGIGVINAIIGIFFYFKVIVSMFMVNSDQVFEKIKLPLPLQLTFILTTFFILILGIFPSLFANILN
jgi:NADH-quinone oxidoreductase subunit N